LAFLKFSRDKRGVEHFSLVHTTTNRRGKVRPRVLYWFRSPPDVKMGREPFDPAIRRALEAQNPDIVFDWRAIVETPIPSADADKWRERRRAERAAKHAAVEPVEPAIADGDADDTELDPSADAVDAGTPASDATEDERGEGDASRSSSKPAILAHTNPLNPEPSSLSAQPCDSSQPCDSPQPSVAPEPSTARDDSPHARRRRRRRSGGGGRGGAAQADRPSSPAQSGNGSSGE
jgi:hypothetical protein